MDVHGDSEHHADEVFAKHQACAWDILSHEPFHEGNGIAALNLILSAVIKRLSEYPTSVEVCSCPSLSLVPSPILCLSLLFKEMPSQTFC